MELKIAFLIVIAGVSNVLATPGYSQVAKVSLDMKDKSLEQVMDNIESQSEFYFIFNQKQIDVNRVVSIKEDNKTITDILPQLFQGTNVNYAVFDRKILLTTDPISKRDMADIESGSILQQITVRGIVTDSGTGEAMPGVNVVVVGTTFGAITDMNGSYTISVPSTSVTLQFSFIGYATQEIPLGGQTNLNVALKNDVAQLNEVVVVGYGTQRKGEVSVSVSQIKSDQVQGIPKTSMLDVMGGRAAGVDVISASGAPGSASTIRIRGANSISSNANPLYVIDGFPVAASMNNIFETSRLGVSGDATDLMAMINPNDIESIEILKDAAATSIYGARGSNGVILITTKSGHRGKSDITLDINTGFQTIAKQWEMMNATEFSKLLYDAYQRGGVNMATLAFDPANKLAIPVDYNTNWLNEILQTGVVKDYNLSFSGGSENTNYSGSVGYLNNNGIIKSNKYERYTARLNAESRGWDGRIHIGLNANLSYVDQKSISNSSVYNAAMTIAPNYPVYFPEGTDFAGYYTHSDSRAAYDVLWGSSYGVASSTALTQASPFYQTNVAKTPTNQARAILNSFLSIEPIKGLVFKTSVGTDLNFSKMKYLIQSYGPFRPTGGSLEHKQDQTNTWLIENTLNYSAKFGKNSLSALLGQSGQKFYKEGLGIACEEASPGNNYINNEPFFVDGWYFNNGVTDHLTDTHKYASIDYWEVASYFGRFNYSYADKYFLTATIRRDGSSKFGRDNKWGLFPGISAGWNIHDESFFNLPFVSQLKLRASVGVVGNGNIGSYLSQSLLTSTPSSLVGTIIVGTRTWESGLVDPSLKWESTRMENFGFDATLINRLNLTADIYWKNTYDLLYGFQLPESTGFNSIAVTNFGSLKQFGFEFMISGDIIKPKEAQGLSWVASLNFDHSVGKITELPAKTNWVGDLIRSYPNKPIGQIYGYQVDGIYNTSAELTDPANPYKSAELGDYKYHDFGSTDPKGNFVMVADTNITAADRVNLGNVNPIISFGFTNTLAYKNFDLNLFFRGTIGNKIYNAAKRSLLDTRGKNNTIKEAVDRWSPDNFSQTIQAANSNRKDPTGTAPLSTFIEDGSYLRLANLSLGYTLPRDALSKILLQNLRIYASINNLFVLTGYSGLDPEIGGGDVLVPRGVDNSSYPKTRTYTMGLQVKF